MLPLEIHEMSYFSSKENWFENIFGWFPHDKNENGINKDIFIQWDQWKENKSN